MIGGYRGGMTPATNDITDITGSWVALTLLPAITVPGACMLALGGVPAEVAVRCSLYLSRSDEPASALAPPGARALRFA
jgi:hypothetical protein